MHFTNRNNSKHLQYDDCDQQKISIDYFTNDYFSGSGLLQNKNAWDQQVILNLQVSNFCQLFEVNNSLCRLCLAWLLASGSAVRSNESTDERLIKWKDCGSEFMREMLLAW